MRRHRGGALPRVALDAARARPAARAARSASRRSSTSAAPASSRSARRRPRGAGRRLCTSGTAAANLHPAVCEADESGVPLIVLTADRPPELRGIGAGQTIDQLKLYGSAVRWFCEVGTHDADDSGPAALALGRLPGFAVAAGDPRPGPVHLNVAWREPLGPQPVAGDVTAVSALALRGPRRPRRSPTSSRRPGRPAGEELDRLAELVRHSRGGLIVAGRMPTARSARRSSSSPASASSRSSPSRPRSCASAPTTATS